ncbi:YeiH family protein [Oleisolibacter albus]|uniref:YeiH family protein n=1 Tax=Oleisolibacter albus TaxID=2171757 RepID=UPI000DF1AE39|nr:putative sulfate exporter family transporter [Oleisolibacter albus]
MPITSSRPLVTGLALALAVSATALLLQQAQQALAGRVWLDGLVLAILVGTLLRSARPGLRAHGAGIHFAAKLPLELAIILLGATLDTQALLAVGPGLLGGIAMLVALSLLTSYGIGRTLGLGHRLALLVACGNSICGNTAIAAAAPVVGARDRETTAALAFTAVLGVGAVLLLPLSQGPLVSSPSQYGVLAGLTVYAVPQVLAATAAAGAVSLHLGTLVKLVRVMLLGPVLLGLSLLGSLGGGPRRRVDAPRTALLPWFILGFAATAALRAAGLVPAAAAELAGLGSHGLTLLAMAGLGLSVDLRTLAAAGGRVVLAASLSLLALLGFSLGLIALLHLP